MGIDRGLRFLTVAYDENDDRVGAMNIQLLGTLWISGEERAHFEKITTSD